MGSTPCVPARPHRNRADMVHHTKAAIEDRTFLRMTNQQLLPMLNLADGGVTSSEFRTVLRAHPADPEVVACVR